MKRKLVSALLCTSLVLGCGVPAFAAAASADQTTVIQVIGALDIMTGDENGNLNLSSNVTRAEFAKMLVNASVYKDKTAAVSNSSPFKDVSYNHWAAAYIKTAVQQGWLTGYLDGTYRPEQTITLEEAATGVLKLLGYGTSDFSGSYPYGQLALYQSLGLAQGVGASQGQTMTREDMMYLFYNMLSADTKEGQTQIEVLGYQLDENGEVDYLSLMADSMEGPIVIQSNLSELGINTAGATIYKNGVVSANATAQKYDVVYYSTGLNTIWIYSNAITGTCQTVSESMANPTSVTVAGNTYTLATADAKRAFSSLGSLRTGDIVTLLLGMDNQVVAAIPASDYAAVATAVYGVVTGTTSQSYTNATGQSYTSYTMNITATDGNTYSYPVDTTYDADTLVKVTLTDSGTKVERLSSNSIEGKVSSDGATFDGVAFADNVEILDVYGSSCLRIYPARLAGATIDASAVRYYSKNDQGEIERLILDDYTGDLHQYGVVTEVSETFSEGSSIPTSGRYTYDIAGQSYTYSSSSVIMNAEEGPAVFKTKDNSLNQIRQLSEQELDSVDSLKAYYNENSYPLAENVAVYLLDDDEYRYVSLGLIQDGDYQLTGYYDKSSSYGGRIRVIVAEANE